MWNNMVTNLQSIRTHRLLFCHQGSRHWLIKQNLCGFDPRLESQWKSTAFFLSYADCHDIGILYDINYQLITFVEPAYTMISYYWMLNVLEIIGGDQHCGTTSIKFSYFSTWCNPTTMQLQVWGYSIVAKHKMAFTII